MAKPLHSGHNTEIFAKAPERGSDPTGTNVSVEASIRSGIDYESTKQLLHSAQRSTPQHHLEQDLNMDDTDTQQNLKHLESEVPEDESAKDTPEQTEYAQLQSICGDGQTKYDLRRQAREAKATFSRTWIDDDRTGCYDPIEERRQLRQRPKRPNPLLKTGFQPWDPDDSEDENEAPKYRSPKPIPRLEVIFIFRSDDGKARFSEHVKALPARLEPTEELFSERRLRRRDSGVGFSHSHSTKSTKGNRLHDDIPDDLTGHPIARGCWGCVDIGIRCPLLDDARTWPCTTCVDDDNECDLITPPTYKRPCEHCKSKRMGCSYTYTRDHEGPCEECARTGWRCNAGPAPQSISERISYDRDWENDPWQEPKVPQPKKLPSCRRCRERDQPCSFSAGDQEDTCTACDMAGETCVPALETLKKSRKRKRTQTKSKVADGKSQSQRDKDLNDGKPWSSDVVGPQTKQHKPVTITESDTESSDFLGVKQKLVPRQKTKSKQKQKQKAIIIEVSSNASDSSDSEEDFLGVMKMPGKTLKSKVKPKQKSITIDSSESNDVGDEDSSDSSELDLDPPPKRTKTSTSKPKNYEKSEGTVDTITTKFAHPIQFNYTGKDSCHFCSDIRFAMFGLGSTEVEVIVWHDGRGLEEMSGGHRSQGIESTRMCIPCTTRRMPVVMCAGHELRQLKGGDNANDNLALARLLSGSTTGQERWCSICPALAQHACCAAGPHGKGCGLMLCEACMIAVASNENNLERTLDELKDVPSEKRVLGLRADCEFLRQEGLLMKYVLWQSQRRFA